jgi:hypothetical protein
MPINGLIIRALMHYFSYYGDNFKIEWPTGSGNLMNLFKVTRKIANRMIRIFLRDESGRRPVFGGAENFRRPYWYDHLLFYKYFCGDNGAGIGASHQTGWIGVVAGPDRDFWQAPRSNPAAGRPGSGFQARDRDGARRAGISGPKFHFGAAADGRKSCSPCSS